MKYLNFTVAETSGRTFELPLEKAIEIIKRIKEEDKYIDDEVDFTDEDEVANFLMNYALDEIAKHELNNDYMDLIIADSEIVEGKE